MTKGTVLAILGLSTGLGCAGAARELGLVRPSVHCRGNDEPCLVVREELENVRANIGGWCGTPDVGAAMRIRSLGPAAATPLSMALFDADPPIAVFAAARLEELGRRDLVQSFCLSGFGITPSAASCCDALSCTVAGSLAQGTARPRLRPPYFLRFRIS